MEKLTPNEIFTKTIIFTVLKIAVYVAEIIVSIILLAIDTAICTSVSGSFNIVGLIIWLVVTVGIYYIVKNFIQYTITAGHVAVVTDAVDMGAVPEGQLNAGIQTVKERFRTPADYSFAAKSVRSCMSQLTDEMLAEESSVPGSVKLPGILRKCISFVSCHLNDCCLAFVIREDAEPVSQSAAEAVIVCHQNWSTLGSNTKHNAMTAAAWSAGAFVFVTALTLVIFTNMTGGSVLGGLFGAGMLGFFVAKIIKCAWLDTRHMIASMDDFLRASDYASFTQGAYDDMCRISNKFRTLYSRAQTDAQQAMAQQNGGVQ